MPDIKLNAGAQKDFVMSEARYNAYIGGVGSGKTFGGIARGLRMAQQPKSGYHGPRGLICAINYPVLKDVVLPQFFEIMDESPLWRNGHQDNSYIRSEKKALMVNNGEILFRSLDRPDWMRGLELSWFYIDEGRHVSAEAWRVLVGRLRQKGYAHSGWVCSTPNGYDWMYDLFHEESPEHVPGSAWFNASTFDNRAHLPDQYLPDLQLSFHGKYYDQEVLGKFVPVMQGQVFPHWDPRKLTADVPYNRELPLYSFWDFGVGDLGVVLFAQIEYKEKHVTPITSSVAESVSIPYLYIVGCIESKDWSAQDWANAYKEWLATHTGGRQPVSSYGDPSGANRNQVTGTSILDELTARGVPVAPAQRRPADYGVVILDNMMAGERFLVHEDTGRLAKALSNYHWNTDDFGNRMGAKPVHDWSSHFVDALRYGSYSLLSAFPIRRKPNKVREYQSNEMGYIVERLTKKTELDRPPLPFGEPEREKILWQPGIVNE